MEFRVDFFLRIVMDIFYYGINIGFYSLIFMHTDLLGGWSMDEMFIFMSGFLVIDAISMTVFANNLWMLPTFINRGELDYYLTRPVSSLFFLSFRDFAADSFVNLVMAFSIMVWAIVRYPEPLSLHAVAAYVMLILCGAMLRYFVRMLFIIPTFWLHSVRGFEMIFFYMNRFIERPDRIFYGWVRVILTSVLPFGLMASFPARLLLDGFESLTLLHFAIIFILFYFAVTRLWKIGLRAYSSASS